MIYKPAHLTGSTPVICQNKTRGMLIIAINDRYLQYAKWQVAHLRAIGWIWPIRIVSNKRGAVIPSTSMEYVSESGDWWHRGVKIRAYKLSPWDFTLCHDADMIPRNIEDIWNFIKNNDFCITLDRERPWLKDAWYASVKSKALTLATAGADTKHFNSGLVLFSKSERTELIYRTWAMEWDRDPNQDEPALARAIARLKIAPTEIPITYNWSEHGKIDQILQAYKRERCIHLWGSGKSALPEIYRILSK